jgi:hypothetical protein
MMLFILIKERRKAIQMMSTAAPPVPETL